MAPTATSASTSTGPLAFLTMLEKSTRKAYRSLLKRYLSHFYEQVEDLEAVATRYLREMVEKDLQDFFASQKEKKVPGLTLRQCQSVVRCWLMENDIELPAKF